MKYHENVRILSDTEKRDFARACNMLKAAPGILNPGKQSRYDDFAQILAGVTSANIVHDPGGALAWGSEHVIPFHVAGADLENGVICPIGLPQIIDLRLETPSGDIICSSDASVLPKVSHRVANGVGFCRMTLPAPPGNPSKSHVEVRKAHLALADRGRIRNWFKRQGLDHNVIAKCLMRACRKAGVDTTGAKTVQAEQRLEMDRIAAAVRKELPGIDPEKIFTKLAGTAKAKTPPEVERSEHPMKEHFMPTKQAPERMQKEDATKSKSRKKK